MPSTSEIHHVPIDGEEFHIQDNIFAPKGTKMPISTQESSESKAVTILMNSFFSKLHLTARPDFKEWNKPYYIAYSRTEFSRIQGANVLSGLEVQHISFTSEIVFR